MRTASQSPEARGTDSVGLLVWKKIEIRLVYLAEYYKTVEISAAGWIPNATPDESQVLRGSYRF